MMKKLFLPFFMFAIAMSLISCGEDNGNEPPEEGGGNPEEHNYTLVYSMWMPSDYLKFVDVELSIYNPVSEKTTTYNINSADQNMFGTKEAELFDYYMNTFSITYKLSSDNDFLYYDVATNVTDGMEYKATISVTVNEEKIATLPDGNYNIAPANVFTYVLDEKGQIHGQLYVSLSTLKVPKEKAITYFQKNNEPKVVSGTIKLSSNSDNNQ